MEQITAEQQSTLQAMGALFSIIFFVVVLLLIIAQWRIYSKAGQPGWACIIPIYNLVVYMQIIGRPISWLMIYIGCLVIYFIGFGMIMNGSLMGGLLTSIGGLVLLVISIIDTNRLSRSFGKGAGFTAGLIILPFIFMPILGFGSAQYIGPNGVGEAVNDNPDVLHN